MMIFGLMVGLIYRDVTDYFVSGSNNRFGAFFFIIMTQVFSNGTALEAFIRERVFFMYVFFNIIQKKLYLLYSDIRLLLLCAKTPYSWKNNLKKALLLF